MWTLDSFLIDTSRPGRPDDEPPASCTDADFAAEYWASFRKQIKNAQANKKSWARDLCRREPPLSSAVARATPLPPGMAASLDIIEAVAHGDSASCAQESAAPWAHVLCDPGQSISRMCYRRDGLLPTLVCGSRIFSFKLKKFIVVSDLYAAMGFPRDTFRPDAIAPTAAQTAIGNSLCVTVSGMTVLAVLLTAGFLAPSTE